MVPLGIKDLSLLIARGLAERYPDEQVLPAELHDAVLAVINSVGLAALNVAVQTSQDRIAGGASPEELESTEVLETSRGFATEYIPRTAIVSLITDMSGLEEESADTVLELVEAAVNESVLGLRGTAPTEVDFEGLGVISAGAKEGCYHIDLAKTLHVPPLRNVSVLSALQDRGEGAALASSSS